MPVSVDANTISSPYNRMTAAVDKNLNTNNGLCEDSNEILRQIEAGIPNITIGVNSQKVGTPKVSKIEHNLKKNRIGMSIYEMPEKNKNKYVEKYLKFNSFFEKLMKKYNANSMIDLFQKLRNSTDGNIVQEIINSQDVIDFMILGQDSTDFILRNKQGYGFYYDRCHPHEQEWLIDDLRTKHNIKLSLDNDNFSQFTKIFKFLFNNMPYSLMSGPVFPHGVEINRFESETRETYSNNFSLFLNVEEITERNINYIQTSMNQRDHIYGLIFESLLKNSFMSQSGKKDELKFQSFTVGVYGNEGHAITICPLFKKNTNGKIKIQEFIINNPNGLGNDPDNIDDSEFVKYFLPNIIAIQKRGLLSPKLNKNINVFMLCLKEMHNAKSDKKRAHYRKQLGKLYQKFISPYFTNANIKPQEKYLSGFCLDASKNISNALAKLFAKVLPEKVLEKVNKVKKLNGSPNQFSTLIGEYDQKVREFLTENKMFKDKGSSKDTVKNEQIATVEFEDKHPLMLNVATDILDVTNKSMKEFWKTIYNNIFHYDRERKSNLSTVERQKKLNKLIKNPEESSIKPDISKFKIEDNRQAIYT